MTDASTQEVKKNLAFVKEVVQRRKKGGMIPLPMAILWGVLSLIGLVLCDVQPRIVGWYWIIVIPANFVVSFLYFWWAAPRGGEMSWRLAREHCLHWIGVSLAIGLLFFLAAVNHFRGMEIAQLALLIGALGYFLGGIHFDRLYILPGILLAGGVIAAVYITTYIWTIVGLAFCVGLILPVAIRACRHG
jgi:hypothetical protein